MGVLFGLIASICLLAWRFGDKTRKTYGSARWATIWEIFREGLLRKGGIRVGDLKGRQSVFYHGAHAITFGVSGSGKGVSAIVPNILSARYLLLVDPGGENTAIAIKSWRERGLVFGCINFFSMYGEAPWALPSHGFNPLDLLDVRSDKLAADALLFAEMLTPRSGDEGGSSAYFKTASEHAKRAMLVHIKTAEPAARQNIATLYEFVNGSATQWQALLAAMKRNPACGGLVAHEAVKLERIQSQAGPEFSAIMSTIQQDLGFLADPLVRAMLSRSDVDFSILKGHRKDQRGGIISIILPLEYVQSHASITRLALACAVLELQRQPLAKNKVLFLIDEAAALGKMTRFPDWLATLRKYRVRLWSIWQNVGQVTHLYGRNWQTIISNCGLRQILGVGDIETAEYTEKLLGRTTIKTVSINGRGEHSVSEAARTLLTADEILYMPKECQIALIGAMRPVVLKKTPYWKRPDLAGRYHANPYFGDDTAQAGAGDYLAALWGAVYYALVCLMAPHKAVAFIVTALFSLLLFGLFTGG